MRQNEKVALWSDSDKLQHLFDLAMPQTSLPMRRGRLRIVSLSEETSILIRKLTEKAR